MFNWINSRLDRSTVQYICCTLPSTAIKAFWLEARDEVRLNSQYSTPVWASCCNWNNISAIRVVYNELEVRVCETRPDQTTPDRTGPDQTRPHETGPDHTRTHRTGPDQTTPDRTRPDRARPDQTTLDQTAQDHIRPDQTRPLCGNNSGFPLQ